MKLNEFKCRICGKTSRIGITADVKYCPQCGASDIKNIESDIRKKYMKQYDEELLALCGIMNPAYETFKKHQERYYKIMEYFRSQLHRGYLTQEQYEERATKFVGYNEKSGNRYKRKEGTNNETATEKGL